MKFLLIKPGDKKTSDKYSINAPTNHPPLSLLSLGAMLESKGHSVEILDYYMEDISREQLKNAINSSDAVGLTILTDDIKPTKNISKIIREIDTNIPLVIGGPHCIFLQEYSMQDISQADISVIGEGEYVILDIVKYIQGKKKLSDIHGIYYRDNGSIKKGKPLKIIHNLDDLPFPARHLVDKYDYGNFTFGYHLKKKVTALITSRGCPYHCRFCTRYSNIIKECNFRQRSAENVVKEIQELDKNYNTALIADDNFLENKKRAHKIFDMLLNIGTDIDLLIEGARVDSADRELYKKMKNAGVTFITYGIESGNQEVIDFYNKKFTINQVRKAVSLAREMGFFTHGSFILGAPMEIEEHIKNTIKFACELPLDSASFGILAYIKGSQLWTEAVKNNKISSDKYIVLTDSKKGLGKLPFEELVDYTYKAYNTFYFRPTYLLRQIYRCLLRKDLSLLINGWKYLYSL